MLTASVAIVSEKMFENVERLQTPETLVYNQLTHEPSVHVCKKKNQKKKQEFFVTFYFLC